MSKLQTPTDPAEAHPIKAGVSRRSMLAGAAIAGAGALCLAATTHTRAQTKQKQSDVAYQASPKDGAKCSGCALFQAPKACQGVEGDISPEGWCQIYSPKA